jgi:hypothetical protein
MKFGLRAEVHRFPRLAELFENSPRGLEAILLSAASHVISPFAAIWLRILGERGDSAMIHRINARISQRAALAAVLSVELPSARKWEGTYFARGICGVVEMLMQKLFWMRESGVRG